MVERARPFAADHPAPAADTGARRRKADRVPLLRERADRWNLFCNTADGALAIFAFYIVAPDFLLSPFLRAGGASDTLIGTLTALVALSTAFIPIFAAHYVQRLRRKKPYVVIMGLFQRTHLFVLPAIAVFVLPYNPTAFFVLYVVSATISSGATQANWPAWSDLVAKVTPVTRRGALWAARNIGGVLPAVILSTQISWMLKDTRGWCDLGPTNYVWGYSLVFLIAGVSFALSLPFVAMLRERGGAIHVPAPGLGTVFKLVPRLLGRDRQFAWFVLAHGLTLVPAGMVGAFFVLTAQDRFPQLHVEGMIGRYMFTGMLFAVAGNVLFAWLGDRMGHRINLVLSAPLLAAACVWAVLAPDPVSYGAVFAMAGLSNAARAISNILIVMEFGAAHERAQYASVYGAVFNPLLALGPFFGGLLRDSVGLGVSFVLAIAMSLGGMAVMLAKVRDPRARLAES